MSCTEEEQLTDKLRERYGINQQESLNLIDKYGKEKIDEKIVQIESSPSFLSGAIKNLAGYLIEALNKDYQPVVSSQVRALLLRKEKENKEWEGQRKKEQQEKIQGQYKEHVNSQIDAVLFDGNKIKSESVKKVFNAWLEKDCGPVVSDQYREKGFSDGIVRSIFRHHLKTNHSDLLPVVQSFDEYAKNLTINNLG